MADKPSVPKGTRDFTPLEMARRSHIFNTIRTIFKIYGYLPIETPAMENLTSLIEPFMLVFLGTVIGGLVVAMYLPIFKMAGAIS